MHVCIVTTKFLLIIHIAISKTNFGNAKMLVKIVNVADTLTSKVNVTKNILPLEFASKLSSKLSGS